MHPEASTRLSSLLRPRQLPPTWPRRLVPRSRGGSLSTRHTSSLLPLLSASRQQQQQRQAASTSASASAATIDTSSRGDYHFPFGNPSLLISTLPSQQRIQRIQQVGPEAVASQPIFSASAVSAPLHTPPRTTPRRWVSAETALPPSDPPSPSHSLPNPLDTETPSTYRNPSHPPYSSSVQSPASAAAAAAAAQKTSTSSDPIPWDRIIAHRQKTRPQEKGHRTSQPQAALSPPPQTQLQSRPHPQPYPPSPSLQDLPDKSSDADTITQPLADEAEPPPFREALSVAVISNPVYVLGTNSQSTYLAHMLAGIPNSPPVRLLLPDSFREKWQEEGSRARILQAGAVQMHVQKRIIVERLTDPPEEDVLLMATNRRRAPKHTRPGLRYVENLVVTLPCTQSIAAIGKLRHRIDRRTTICLMQQGLGVAERLNELYFPDEGSRPRYVLGHMSHSLSHASHQLFSVSELAPGNLWLTVYRPWAEKRDELEIQELRAAREAREARQHHHASGRAKSRRRDDYHSGRWLVQLMSLTPSLGAGGFSLSQFLRLKLPAMVYDASVEPVATLLDVAPYMVWESEEGRQLVHALMQEMVAVVAQLPETQQSPLLSKFVQSGALLRQALRRRPMGLGQGSRPSGVHGISGSHDGADSSRQGRDHGSGRGSGSSSSSRKDPALESKTPWRMFDCRMRRHVRRGMMTDIQFLNGWFVRRGAEVGVACPQNEAVMRLVRAKQRAVRAALDRDVPLVLDESPASLRQAGQTQQPWQHWSRAMRSSSTQTE